MLHVSAGATLTISAEGSVRVARSGDALLSGQLVKLINFNEKFPLCVKFKFPLNFLRWVREPFFRCLA